MSALRMADRELPAGSVIVLSTDIEGSTRLIEELGEPGYIGALAEHRHLLRAAFAAHGGIEVDTQGDAFPAPRPTVSSRRCAGQAREESRPASSSTTSRRARLRSAPASRRRAPHPASSLSPRRP